MSIRPAVLKGGVAKEMKWGTEMNPVKAFRGGKKGGAKKRVEWGRSGMGLAPGQGLNRGTMRRKGETGRRPTYDIKKDIKEYWGGEGNLSRRPFRSRAYITVGGRRGNDEGTVKKCSKGLAPL